MAKNTQPITGHDLYDSLAVQEMKVAGFAVTLTTAEQVEFTDTAIPAIMSRSCGKSLTCKWGHVVQAGGTPCNKCRSLILGDYYVKKG